jgi:hypothetical protein
MIGILADNFLTGNDFWASNEPELLDPPEGGSYNDVSRRDLVLGK